MNSVKQSLDNLRIKLSQKNFIVVTGNVYDRFIDIEKNSFFNINDYIAKTVHDDFDHQTFYYTPAMGKQNLTQAKSENKKQNIIDFLEDLKNEIVQNQNNDDPNVYKNNTYIVDFADIYYDNQSQGDNAIEKIAQILSALLAVQGKERKHLVDPKKTTKMIWIMRDVGNILNFITNHNSEYAEVMISKPDTDERKDLFKYFGSAFDVSDGSELRKEGSSVLNVAAGLTEGLSYREILQIAKIRFSPDDEQKYTFKELYNLTTLKSKTSAWEKLDFKDIKNIEQDLAKKVFGQDYAINAVCKTIKRSYMGLAGSYQGFDTNKPKGILFFVGPTGVGKTEMAKALAEFIFKDPKKMIRFDMSEFSQEHSDQRLIGSPPGYVGYDAGGELTNAVKENPNSIILFDEIEKAHPRILDKFLQILEDGRLTSSKGELINFSETFIIFTSNIGTASVESIDDEKVTRNNFLNAVKAKFNDEKSLNRPEILGRIGEENIIPFNFIKDFNIIKTLMKAKFEKQNEILRKKHRVYIDLEDESSFNDLMQLLENEYRPKKGGRGLIEVSTNLFTNPLVEWLINNVDKLPPIDETRKVKFQVRAKKISFELE